MDSIYCGIFWVLCDYDPDYRPIPQTFNLLTFKVQCDLSGTILNPNVRLNSKSGTSFNHKMQWGGLSKKITSGHSYQYYPRGRVEMRHGKAVVFLNPVINEASVIENIKIEFGLNQDCINNVEVKCDGSRHYHCRFNDSSIF